MVARNSRRREAPLGRGIGRLFRVSAVLLALGCQREAGSSSLVGSAASGLAGQAESGAVDVAAYRRGVTRELALVRAAVAALRRTGSSDERAVLAAGATSERTVAEGARAAGLPLNRYRRLVAVVDSLLLTKADSTMGGPAREGRVGPAPLGAVAGVLDSLRIELVVARSLLLAEGARPCRGGAGAAC